MDELEPEFSSIVLLNGQSVSPAASSSSRWKLPYIKKTIIDESCPPPPFIAITETWLKSYMTDAQVTLANYQTLRSDRPTRVGGGCLLYVHDQLVITETDSYADAQNNMVMCYVKSCHTLCATVYRPPGPDSPGFKSLLENLQSHIDEISESGTSPDIYITGDFNYPDWDWNQNSPEAGMETHGKYLAEFIDRNFLTQMVKNPTRGANILDLILTNVPRYVADVQVMPTPISDHDMVKVRLGFNLIKPRSSVTPPLDPFSFRSVNFHEADYNAVNNELSIINWTSLWELCEGELDNFLELFRLTILQITLVHSPKKETPEQENKRIRRRNKDTYVLKRRRRKMNARIRALTLINPHSETLQKLKEEVARLCYDIQEGILSKISKKEKKAVETIKKNPKYFFSYAKRLQKTRSTIPVLKDKDGTLVENPTLKAEILQNQYQKVFSDPEKANVEKCLQSPGIPQGLGSVFNDLSFTRMDIIEALGELDPYSAAPDDEIPARVLTSCKEMLADPLTLLWSKSFDEGYIPETLKTQFISPIFKKGDRTDPSNYRPVSLTSHIIKTFERVVRKSLVEHLESHELISPNQHGFRKKRSCMTQLLAHVEQIYHSLNDNKEVDVIYLDFAKAFDKVDHAILMAKLEKYGIQGKALKWIKEFLVNRKQTVVVEGHKSSYQWVKSGVPQGTVLGPILFVLYINDLLSSINYSKGFSFADDTKLIGAISGLEDVELLQEDLNTVIEWSKNNNMELHENKFEVVSYPLNESKIMRELPFYSETVQYSTPGGVIITPQNTVRDLGVYISGDRKWRTQIDKTAEAAKKMAAWVLSAFHDRSVNVMLTLYKSMVRSRLEYCCPVWNPTHIGEIQRLENVQRSFTRRIQGCKELTYWERLKKLNLMSLQRRRERYCIVHVWKILNDLAPNDIGICFQQNMRLGIKAEIPAINKKSQMSVRADYDRTFRIRAAQLFNLLPANLRSIKKLDSFKIELGKVLEQYPDTPPVPGYTTTNDNSLLSWRRTHPMQLSCA